MSTNTINGTMISVIANVRKGNILIFINCGPNKINKAVIAGYIAIQMRIAIFHFFGGFIVIVEWYLLRSKKVLTFGMFNENNLGCYQTFFIKRFCRNGDGFIN